MSDSANTPSTPPGKSLFSRHYLETHLPRHAEWAEDPQPAFERLAELWERGQRLGPTWNESQTETEFLRPADLLAVLRQNRRKLAVDPSGCAFQERLQAEHAASLAVLLPLKRRLAATDRLIDQVVYRLYGLTNDEVAIVEGHHA